MPWVASIGKVLEVAMTTVWKGSTIIPAEIRRDLDIKDGDKIVWTLKGGLYFVRKAGAPVVVGTKPKFSDEPTKEELELILRRKGLSEEEIQRILEGR